MKRCGLTLLELGVVLAILAALASIAVLNSGAVVQDSRGDVTRQSLTRLRDLIAQPIGRTPIGLSRSAT